MIEMAVMLSLKLKKCRSHRGLVLATPGLGEFISGVILYYDETNRQSRKDGTTFVKVISDAVIIPGVSIVKDDNIAPFTQNYMNGILLKYHIIRVFYILVRLFRKGLSVLSSRIYRYTVLSLLSLLLLSWDPILCSASSGPADPFSFSSAPAAPVYSDISSWAVTPKDTARYPVDVLFFYPTTYFGKR